MPDLATLLERWPQLGALLDEALEMPPTQRLAWLAARSDLPQPLRQLVGDLLAREAAAPRELVPATAHVTPAAATLQPGTEVGPTDSCASWARAAWARSGWPSAATADQATGGAEAAAHGLDRRARPAHGARARHLAGLQHPHIARLLDAGVDALGRPYLALEHVEGEPIDRWCAQRAAPLRQQLELLLQVADAVAYAHSGGVLHRDLKPANILVTADAQVRLLDFGIAKLMHEGRAVETALTHEVGRALSVEYASPEQVRGKPLGASSDIYSLASSPSSCWRACAASPRVGGRRDRDRVGQRAQRRPCAPRAAARRPRCDSLQKAMHVQAAQRYASADAFAQTSSATCAASRSAPDRRARRDGWRGGWPDTAPARHHRCSDGGRRARPGRRGDGAAIALLAATALVAVWQAARARRQSAEAERQPPGPAVQHFLQGIFEPLSLDHATRSPASA